MNLYSKFLDLRSFVFLMLVPCGAAYALVEEYGVAVALFVWGIGTVVLFGLEVIARRDHIQGLRGKVSFFMLSLVNLMLASTLYFSLSGNVDYYDEIVIRLTICFVLIAINLFYGLAFVVPSGNDDSKVKQPKY